jgi:hypothetical protein
MRFPTALLACGLLAATAFGQPPSTAPVRPAAPKKVEPREIDLSEVKVEFTQGAKLTDPVKLTTAADLKSSVLEPLAGTLKVDFKTEYVLLFQWQGSGQDKLTPETTTKDGKTVVTFTHQRGLTKDLRQHSKAFIVPAAAEYKVAK